MKLDGFGCRRRDTGNWFTSLQSFKKA